MKELKNITPMEQDFGRWFTDVVIQGNLIDYGLVKGMMIFKPISYGIWENIQKNLDPILKKEGANNVYLPLLIPKSLIDKEKEHVEGFAPELATVTHVGNKKLEEDLYIRPTSEVLFCTTFSKDVDSYNDLPLIYNQWVNVLRWEKTTNPFLRNSEFLWQEGHSVHSSEKEAMDLTTKMINNYAKFCEEFLAMPVIIGQKTEKEKFAGADITYTIEAMMKDGKALQSGTSHYLGQNFSKSYDIKFKDSSNKHDFAYQTSWGVSTRLIGAIIMAHGDNRGIVIPPKVAHIQIDLIPLFADKNKDVADFASNLFNKLSTKWRVRMDKSKKSPGYKASESEIQGTPIRIEVGPRDLEAKKVVLVRRDTLEKIDVSFDSIESSIESLFDQIHQNLFNQAQNRLNDNIAKSSSYEEMKQLLDKRKFVLVPFDGSKEDEDKIKEETLATARCIPFNMQDNVEEKCIITNKLTKRKVIFARAY